VKSDLTADEVISAAAFHVAVDKGGNLALRALVSSDAAAIMAVQCPVGGGQTHRYKRAQ